MASKMMQSNVPANLDCPVCKDKIMSIPIYLCKVGHSICNKCTKALKVPVCPLCRQDMTQMRNWKVEEIITETEMPCPNKNVGCKSTAKLSEMSNHLVECVMRDINCPRSTLGICSWKGNIQNMMDHFKQSHQEECNWYPNSEINLSINTKSDDRIIKLFQINKNNLFFITIKIDTHKRMFYATIQYIGLKLNAFNWLYNIELKSKHYRNRKICFTDHCFNDIMATDEIFSINRCAVLHLKQIDSFIKDGKILFLFSVSNISNIPKPNNNNKDNNDQEEQTKKTHKPKFNQRGPNPHTKNKN